MEIVLTILMVTLLIILLILLLGLMVRGLIYVLSDRLYRHLTMRIVCIMRIVWTNRALEGTDEKDANPSTPGPASKPTSTTELLPTEDFTVA